MYICYYMCYVVRMEKEKNHIRSEVEDLQTQLEHVQKGKVGLRLSLMYCMASCHAFNV